MAVCKNQLNPVLLRIGSITLLLIFILLGVPYFSFASRCADPETIVDWFQKSDAVFLGKLTYFNEKSFDLANFKVEKTWKGVLDSKIALLGMSRWYDKHQNSRRYFVFAKRKMPRMYIQYGCSLIYEAKLGNWKNRREDWKYLVLNLLAKGYDEKKLFKKMLDIAQHHKEQSFQRQSFDLAVRLYFKNNDRFPKGSVRTLEKLANNFYPELNFKKSEFLKFIQVLQNKTISERIRRNSCTTLLTPRKEYQFNRAVFLGHVVFLGKTFRNKDYLAVFKVEKSWKGAEEKKIKVAFEYADEFQMGKRYLVYAGGSPLLSSYICNRTRIASNIEFEKIYLDQLASGMKEEEIFKWLLETAQSHPEKETREQALGMLDAEFNVSTFVIPEEMEGILKKMADNPDYEHRQYAQTILDKIKLSRENRKFLP